MKGPVSFLAVIAALSFFPEEAAALPEGEMKIKINADGISLTAVLNNTPTSWDLWNRLPVSVTFYPHQNREFYTNMTLSGNPDVQDGYAVGDIAYWTPGNAVVLYYGEGYTGNLIIMGRITAGLEHLKQRKGSFSARLEKAQEE